MRALALILTPMLLLLAFVLGGFSEIRGLWLVNAIWVAVFAAVLPRSNVRREGAAGLMALGVGAALFFLQLHFWPQVTNLDSDPLVYDAVASAIASDINLLAQFNPLAFEYVYEAGLSWGDLANPGFYKVSGIIYSVLGDTQNRHVLSAAFINVTSYALLGFFLMGIFGHLGCKARVAWALWFVFLLTPWLVEQLYVFRKDMLLLALTAGSLYLISLRRHWTLIAVAIYVVGTMRFPQAIALLGIWIIFILNSRSRFSGFIRSRFWLSGVSVLIILIAVILPVDVQIAPESIEALDRDRREASVGFSAILEASKPGVVAYVLAYPFPSLVPTGMHGMWITLFAWLGWGCFAIVLLHIKRGRFDNHLVTALLWAAMTTLSLMVVQSLWSWQVLGYVIAESRFKLFPHLMFVLLVAHFVSNNTRVRRDSLRYP